MNYPNYLIVFAASIFLLFSCDKDTVLDPYQNAPPEEKLHLTVWEYGTFDYQDIKTGAYREYYKKGYLGSAVLYKQAESVNDELLFEYQVVLKDQRFHVYFSENNTIQDEKLFELLIKDRLISEIIAFNEGSQISKFSFNYNGNVLASITQNGILIINDVEYDSNGNIIRISQNDGISPHFHFNICTSQNPYKGIFRDFNIRNIYIESLFSIVSFLNPNYVLDIASSIHKEFDWNTYSVRKHAEVNDNKYPHIIRERKYDTQGNIVENRIIAEYEYH